MKQCIRGERRRTELGDDGVCRATGDIGRDWDLTGGGVSHAVMACVSSMIARWNAQGYSITGSWAEPGAPAHWMIPLRELLHLLTTCSHKMFSDSDTT